MPLKTHKSPPINLLTIITFFSIIFSKGCNAMNIIIVGCGKVGQKLAAQLCTEENQNVTIIDLNYEVVQTLINKYDIMGVAGNGVHLETLTEAGIEDADLFIAVTGSDELNLLACLIAKKAGNCQTIARVRNPEYSKEMQLVHKDLGLALIINPEQTAADEIARVIKFPAAIKIDRFAKGRVEILKFRIPDGSILENMPLHNIQSALKVDVLICGVERGDEAFIPRGNFVLRSGDIISILTHPKNVNVLFKTIGLPPHKVKNTIIVGGGETGYYLAKNLIKSGISVKIIDKDLSRCDKLCQLLPKATIINADGTDSSVLLEEGIKDTDALVALTNIDEENILLSLFVKSTSDAKVVTKINRIDYTSVISTLPLDTIVYPKDITAERIAHFVRSKANTEGNNIETMHKMLDGKAEALEFYVGSNSPLSDKALESLNLRDDVIVACIHRSGKVFIPRGKDAIMTGDYVIVVTTKGGMSDITDILNR